MRLAQTNRVNSVCRVPGARQRPSVVGTMRVRKPTVCWRWYVIWRGIDSRIPVAIDCACSVRLRGGLLSRQETATRKALYPRSTPDWSCYRLRYKANQLTISSGGGIPHSANRLRPIRGQNPAGLRPFSTYSAVRAIESTGLWRKRVGVEPTIRPAKDRIAGFEGREDHRTPFASGESIGSGANGFNRGRRSFGTN